MNTIFTRCLSVCLLAFSLLPLSAQQIALQRLPAYVTGLVFRGDELWYADEVSLIKRDRHSGELLQQIQPQPGFDGYLGVSLDAAGNLWLAVGNGGVARFDGISQWQVWNAQNTPVFPKDFPFLNVFVNAADEVWAYGYDGISGRYFFFNGQAWQEETALANRLYRKFLNGPQNEFIFCARDTLLIRENNAWKSIPEPEEGTDNRLNAPVFDPQGRLWVTTDYSKIYRYDDLSSTPSLVTDLSAVNDIAFDAAGTLFAGTTNHRLARWDGQNWDILNSLANTQSLPFTHIYALLPDPDGGLWIAQDIDTDITLPVLTRYANQVPVKNFYSGVTGTGLIGADRAGNMWFGSGPVLTRQNTADGSLDYFEFLDYQSDRPKKLAAGLNNDLWLLTLGGRIWRFDGTQWQIFVSDELPQTVFDLTADTGGRVYFSGYSAPLFQDKIVIFNPADTTWSAVDLFAAGNAVINGSEVEADKSGNVWFGTDQGLGKQAADGSVAVFPTPGFGQWPNGWLELGIGPAGKVYVIHKGDPNNLDLILYEFDVNAAAWTPIPWPIPELAQFSNPIGRNWWHVDPKGRIWVAYGNRTWVRETGIWTEIVQSPDLFVNTFGSSPDGQVYLGFYAYLGRFNASGHIDGLLLHDTDDNCNPSAVDVPLPGFLLLAEGNGGQYAGLSRPDGSYRIYTPPGTMTVSAVLPGNLWQACLPGGATVQVQEDSAVALDFLLKALADCPLMSVDLSTAFLRRCFDNVYVAKVCNTGTVQAQDAYVDISLPADMELKSASLPYTQVAPLQYRFPLGTVAAAECVTFSLTLHVRCENTAIGQSLCVQAEVQPDTLCIPSSAWNGATVLLDAACTGDSVRFTLKNTGAASTSQPLSYRLLRNLAVEKTGTFTLQAGQTRSFSQPATGDTWRLMAAQEPGHPFAPLTPSLAVEGCVTGSGPFETGHVTAFANSSGSGFSDLECQEIIGSYDPNDKTALPKGAGDDTHFILPGTALDYTIRFQNTGTDTAFTVVVRDTLDRLLDLATLQPGVSSHPYRLDIHGRALAFVFENILLPDSNVNLAGSQGFVTFRIRPRADLPLGSVVYNSAAIYFDFNEPVLTNTVWHIVDENFFPTVATGEPQAVGQPRLLVFPNPAQDRFWVKAPYPAGTLDLFDPQGRLLQRVRVGGEAPVLLECADCPSGLYALRFTGEGKVVGGKVVKRN